MYTQHYPALVEKLGFLAESNISGSFNKTYKIFIVALSYHVSTILPRRNEVFIVPSAEMHRTDAALWASTSGHQTGTYYVKDLFLRRRTITKPVDYSSFQFKLSMHFPTTLSAT